MRRIYINQILLDIFYGCCIIIGIVLIYVKHKRFLSQGVFPKKFGITPKLETIFLFIYILGVCQYG